MIKVIHVADFHLGGAYPEKAEASVKFLIDHINDPASVAYQPDLICCTGDTTQQKIHVNAEQFRPITNLIHGIDCPIIFLQGTWLHEPIGFLRNLESATGGMISVLDDVQVNVSPLWSYPCWGTKSNKRIGIASFPAISKFGLEKWATELLGTPGLTPEDNIRSLLDWIGQQWKDFSGPKLLLGHWTVAGAVTPSGQTLHGGDLAIGREDLGRAGANAVLLGHIHKVQEWPEPCLISYCGSTHPCDWGELDQKSFSLFEFDEENGSKVKLTRIPYPHKPMMKINVEYTGEVTEAGWERVLEEPLPSPEEAAGFEIQICYSVPSEVKTQIGDAEVSLDFRKAGIIPADVKRTVKASARERIANIDEMATTRQQYDAVCKAKGKEPRPGALEKADLLDQGMVTA